MFRRAEAFLIATTCSAPPAGQKRWTLSLLQKGLIEAGYNNVNIDEQIQPDLLGGLVVKIGARLFDSSLKSRLQRLQYAMKGAA